MKKCESCNIEINGSEKICPLCQNKVYGESEKVIFPKNVRLKTSNLIYKLLLFSSFVISIIFGFIELNISNSLKYTIYISLGLLTNLYIVYFILKNSQNVLKMFEKYGIFLVFITLVWYFVTKRVIITNYIIPSICLFELIFNFVCGIILKGNYLVKYSGLIVLNIVLLTLPGVLVLIGLTTNNLMSYICLIFELITITGLLIFGYDQIKEELSKIFNL